MSPQRRAFASKVEDDSLAQARPSAGDLETALSLSSSLCLCTLPFQLESFPSALPRSQEGQPSLNLEERRRRPLVEPAPASTTRLSEGRWVAALPPASPRLELPAMPDMGLSSAKDVQAWWSMSTSTLQREARQLGQQRQR